MCMLDQSCSISNEKMYAGEPIGAQTAYWFLVSALLFFLGGWGRIPSKRGTKVDPPKHGRCIAPKWMTQAFHRSQSATKGHGEGSAFLGTWEKDNIYRQRKPLGIVIYNPFLTWLTVLSLCLCGMHPLRLMLLSFRMSHLTCCDPCLNPPWISMWYGGFSFWV